MPKYHFDIKNGHRLEDPTGLECEDDGAAAERGKIIASEIAKEVPSTVNKRRVAVMNEKRDEVASIKIGVKNGGQ